VPQQSSSLASGRNIKSLCAYGHGLWPRLMHCAAAV